MERDFYQTLRKIQKAERNKKSTLSRVGDDFYKKMYSHIKELEHSIQNNPFSNEEHNLLKNSQIVATEICQLREKKIGDMAISNIQRSYILFAKGRPQFDVVDTTPLNLTPEEEILYYGLMDILKEHRSRISLDKYAEEGSGDIYSDSEDDEAIDSRFDEDYDLNSSNSQNSHLNSAAGGDFDSTLAAGVDSYSDGDVTIFTADDDYDYSNEDPYVFAGRDDDFDEVSRRFSQIRNARIIDDEKYEPIEKQIANQKLSQAKEQEGFSQNGEDDSVADSEEEFQSINPLSQDDEFKNPFDEDFPDLNEIEDNHEDDYNQMNAEMDRFNEDLNNLSSEVEGSRKEKIEKTAVMITEEISSIIGVDEKVYGPFNPEDVVILPKLNADVLINGNKARTVDI